MLQITHFRITLFLTYFVDIQPWCDCVWSDNIYFRLFCVCRCQILEVSNKPVDKMSSDSLISSLQSASALDLTVRYNVKGNVYDYLVML